MFLPETFGRMLLLARRVFSLKTSSSSISKYPVECLSFKTPGRLFYRRFWNQIMKLFYVISDGPCIFIFYIIRECLCFFDTLCNKVIIGFTCTRCHQLAFEAATLFNWHETWQTFQSQQYCQKTSKNARQKVSADHHDREASVGLPLMRSFCALYMWKCGRLG